MFVLGWFFEHPWLMAAVILGAVFVVQSLHRIGPTEVGLVTKRFGWKFVPDVLVTGGNGGGAFEGLAATAMHLFGNGSSLAGKPPLDTTAGKPPGQDTSARS